MGTQDRDHDIAVVGMSCRFPGARDTAEYWRNLCAGVESIARFSHDDLRAAGVSAEALRDPAFVGAYGALPEAYAFDAPFFGVTDREAQAMDPQQRVFLECAWSALEDAGYDPTRCPGAVGVFAGSGSTAHLTRALHHPDLLSAVEAEIANGKDFLTTRVSYKLGLRGPSIAVQTACSTALVAIHLACQSLLGRECDLALAGGVTVAPDQVRGYRYQPGGILSPDGHCRAFDARAAGTVAGSGAGIVVLKRLVDALRDGDTIDAVIKGSALNNDGSTKIGFTAPSISGQAQAIAEALAVAGIDPATVSLVETHGTGTPLGDPIEIAALTEVFRASTTRTGFCALGAVKSNIGHVDCAAGVAGFIKAVLSLKHRLLPPLLHFEQANPEAPLDDSPFYVNRTLQVWPDEAPRRAGVSSFGMGGTNAHVVLEEAPEPASAVSPAAADRAQLVILSARRADALPRMRERLSRHLAEQPRLLLADVASTLQDGRTAQPYRWAAVSRDVATLRAALTGDEGSRPTIAACATARAPAVAFLFPGQGTQYPGVARELYACAPVFRRELDGCAEALAPALGLDPRTLLFPSADDVEAADARLRQTCYTQPVLFAIEYALARLWMSWGVQPQAMLGHSSGEYVAACLAGVFSLEQALRLVAIRGRLMQARPPGAMVAVPLGEADTRACLSPHLSVAALNSPLHSVVSGPIADVEDLEQRLAAHGVVTRRLHTSHAFHSAMMDPVVAAFTEEVRRAQPAAPTMPFLSNVTGDWITSEQATDPRYWGRHLREPVRFADAAARLLEDATRVFLEVGPGDTLGTFVRRLQPSPRSTRIVQSLPGASQATASDLVLLEAAGSLWSSGVAIDWPAMRAAGPGRRIPLPTYPFARTEYWLPRPHDPVPARAPVVEAIAPPSDQTPTDVSRTTARVRALFGRLLGTEPALLDATRSFLELGADSLLLMQAARVIESTCAVRVPFRQLMDGLSTIERLSAHLDREAPPDPEPAPPASSAAPDTRLAPGIDRIEPIVATSHGPHRPVRESIEQGGPLTARQARHVEDLQRRYTARTQRSKAYAAAHRPVLADNRASLNFRQATKELLYPVVGERSQGARLWDVDGHEYLDFTLGFGVHFFGHRPPFVVQAVEEQLRRGFHLGPQSDLAGPVARLLSELTGMERVTFCNTGSEAVMTALRIARAVTGRDRIVIFSGSYHGTFDGVLARSQNGPDAGDRRARPVAPGTPQAMVDDVTVLPYGTPDAMDWLREHAIELAAVLVEPIQTRNPEFHPREFLRELRSLTTRTGTVLIFDEIVTGLRLQQTGAQGWYGIDADLATYGKVIGGGFPLGVVAGRAALMDAVDGGCWNYGDDSYPMANQTFFAGTFCKHPVVMAAAYAVLRHVREQGPALYADLNARTTRLVSALRAAAAAARAPITIVHCASMFQFRYDRTSRFGDLLFYHLLEQGIYVWEGRGCFLSTAHTDADCDQFVRAFRDSLDALRDGGFLPEVPAVTRRSFPLTPAQRQVWLHAQCGDDASRAYHEQMVMALRGVVEIDAMRAALQDVMRHHEALRTVFDPTGETQHVLPSVPIVLRVERAVAAADAEALAAALGEAAARTFDPRTGPLFRLHIHPCGADRHVVQIVFHHLAMDALGAAVFRRDLDSAYRARREGTEPRLPAAMQFSDYAALMAAHGARHAEAETAWRARFDGVIPFALPTDRPRSPDQANPAAQATQRLPRALVSALKAFSRGEGQTLFTTLLASWLAMLHRTSGQDDIITGIPSAGRPFPGSESLVGHCVDVLPVRSRLAGATRLRAYVQDMRRLLLDAYEHDALSLARLRETLDLPRGATVAPIVSVSFNVEPGRRHQAGEIARFAGLAIEPVATRSLFTKFDLHVDAIDLGEEIELLWVFNAGLFERDTIARMQRHLERVLEHIAAGRDVCVSALHLLSAAEEAQLTAWNDTACASTAVPVHRSVAEWARTAPDAIAILFDGGGVTYGALDRRSDALARRLRALGVGPEVPVGLCLERTADLVAGVLGIWKAGGAFVSLDPVYPPERLRAIVADAGLSVIVTAGNGAGVPSDPGVTIVRIDEPVRRGGDAAAGGPVSAVGVPSNLAYIIYTSGSTGRPNGVLVPHDALANCLAVTRDAFTVRADDVMPALASYAFDIWLFEVFLPLTSGAAVRLIAGDRVLETPALHREIADATLLHAVPALMRQVIDAERAAPRLRHLRQAFVGGDLVPSDLLAAMRAVWPDARTHVLYGPTEATILASAHALAGERPAEGHPIGRPLGNVQLHVCDARGHAQPPGVAGELLIGGHGVARGYAGQPRLTAARFIPSPFDGAGRRVYRTGDRARWRADGTLEFLGRVDDQVKIRGFRIEPGDVEAALTRHPAVREARVIARGESGEPRLVAYVVGAIEIAAIRLHLQGHLPAHMLPAAIVRLDRLPRTPNGKVDTQALPLPMAESTEGRCLRPRTPVEEALIPIWINVLGVADVDVTDDFFALGGHSLLVMRLTTHVHAAFGVDLPIRTVFDARTLESLANEIARLVHESVLAMPDAEAEQLQPAPVPEMTH